MITAKVKEKVCRLCWRLKPVTEFSVLGGRRLHSYCKHCVTRRSMYLRACHAAGVTPERPNREGSSAEDLEPREESP